jgi:endoglucanase
MRNRYFPLLVMLLLTAAFTTHKPETVHGILYNQVGYINSEPKMLLVPPDGNRVRFINADGKEVLQVTPAPSKTWDASGTSVRKVDFSALTIPGAYTVLVNGAKTGPEITINSKPYHKLLRSALKAFYLHRMGIPIEERYAGLWARPSAHPDTLVYVHASAAGPGRPEGSVISSPGGWYDAGDYNKYIVNSAITTYTLFKALEDYPGLFRTLNLNIPESGKGGIPDILDEALYNYRWMLTMQDPADGGVYHKLTNKTFDAMVMPDKATAPRYVVMKTTAAALDLAAVAAHASVLLKDYGQGYAPLATESIDKAEKAWAWAKQHPTAYYRQPEDIRTGAYGDDKLQDEWFWAAAELYLATGKAEYADAIVQNYQKPHTSEWSIVHGLGFMSLLSRYDKLPEKIIRTGLRADFLAHADRLVALSINAPFGVSIQRFVWGSNSYVANEGMLKLFAFQLTMDPKYRFSALSDLDYLLGRNATGYCFVTGYGDKRVMHIHHRPSSADGIAEPQPGFLAGGPNLDTFTDCPDDKTRSRTHPAISYEDRECSYSTNEIAINWNAPFVYLAGAFD